MILKCAVGVAGFLSLMLGSSAYAASPAGSTTPTISPATAEEYIHPHDLIDVGGGRKMNLFCMGTGGHTVLFDAGGSDWSAIWALVQPAVAEHARACSYDRAGLGYSDPSRDPRAAVFIADDLHALIRAAKIDTPVLLVGHSLGGFNMKLYAALYPEDVAGLVLVDPFEESLAARTQNALVAKFGAARTADLELRFLGYIPPGAAHYADCAAAARSHDLDPASELFKNCADPAQPSLGPKIGAEWQRLQVKSAYQEAQASEISNADDNRYDGLYAMLFSKHPLGGKPLIVLTSDFYDPKNPVSLAGYFVRNFAADQTAALSTRGVHRIVPNTRHYIQIDQPQAVIDAVNEVLGEVGAK
jgi:pimeloyl-ACP methyl ester carboxylesterase